MNQLHRQFLHSLVLGDKVPCIKDKQKIANEFKLPKHLQFNTARGGLKFTYQFELENCRQSVLN